MFLLPSYNFIKQILNLFEVANKTHSGYKTQFNSIYRILHNLKPRNHNAVIP